MKLPREYVSLCEGAIEIELRRLVPTTDGRGMTSRVYAVRSGTVELLIHRAAVLAELGPKALRSKHRKSRALSGAVIVRVLRSKDVEAAL